MKRIFLIAALGLSCLATTAAFAASGYVTANVNLRAGPDIGYPVVDVLRAGTPVVVYGCVDGWSWCDVSAGADRGWMAGSFLQEAYQGRRVLVADYGVRIGIPIVSFVFGNYWADHYRGRSWYGNRDRWSHIRPSYRPVRGPAHGPIHAHPAAPPHRPPPAHGHPGNGPHPGQHGNPHDDRNSHRNGHDNHNDHRDHGH